MSDPKSCPHCGKPLPESALGGLCPECMLNVGVATQTAEEPANGGTAPLPRPIPPLEPTELARHFPQLEILECLGRGGMGVVYKARQPTLNRLVALKVLAPEKGGDPKFAGRFSREAQALARLNHPNIVTVHDFGEVEGLFYLLMEFVDGVSLRQLLARKEIAPEAALAIVPRLCEALQYAHEQGIVHRDIKPENVLLDKTGRVKIADFGIAKMRGEETARTALTEERQVIGTPHYMAPEQVERPLLVDHRADIYSLGVVFYEMLTGELPLGRFAPPSRKVQIDVRLDQVVLHALEKEPERRYQQASEVKTDVERIVAEGPAATIADPGGESLDAGEPKSEAPTAASRMSQIPDVGPKTPDPRSETRNARPDAAGPRRRRALWYGFIVSLLGVPVGLAMGAAFIWMLGLLGIVVSAFKLGLLEHWTAWSRIAGATEPSGTGTGTSQRPAEPGLALAFEQQLHRLPRILWLPILLMLLIGIMRALGHPREPITALANVLLALGLFFRSKLAYALTVFFGVLGLFAVASTGAPWMAAGVLLINALVLVPLLLCAEWYFPRAPVSGQRLRVEEITMPLMVIPPMLFLVFLRGGHRLLGIDLDADVLLVVGVVGLPFSVFLGMLLAWAVRRALPPSVAGQESADDGTRRWSGWTIAALSLFSLSLPLAGGLSVMFQLIVEEGDWNPSSNEALVTLALSGVAVMAILGTVALGAEALRRMRLDPGRSRGRLGAWASVWLWPCVLAGALLTPVRTSGVGRRTEEARRLAELQRRTDEAAAGFERRGERRSPGELPPPELESATSPTREAAPDGFNPPDLTGQVGTRDRLEVTADGRGEYRSIQAALDAAPTGAVIRIGPGRFDERLTITKPVTLEGAGWTETVVGPVAPWTAPPEAETRALQQTLRDAADPEAQQRVRDRLAQLMPQPVVRVQAASSVRFSNLRFVLPGFAPAGRLLNASAIELHAAEVSVAGSAIVGSAGNGIQISNGSRLTLSNTLIAAVWNTGIAVPRGGNPCALTVMDSDIRNCHYAGIVIGRGRHTATVERCRVSGAAWHGIRYDDAAPSIANSLIFGNARCGIYASGKTSAHVRGNVFWKNEMNGMSCWFENRDRIENNTFAANLREGVAILGASEPILERNVFWGHPQALLVGAISGEGATAKASGVLHLTDNVFWTNTVNLEAPPDRPPSSGDAPASASRALEDFPGNRETDPGFADPSRGDFTRPAASGSEVARVGAVAPLPLASPWPLQPEERAMIPDGETRDSRAWKRDGAP